jgi:hypothetical protein
MRIAAALACLTVLAFGGRDAFADPTTSTGAGHAPRPSNPDWIKLPTGDDFARNYPPEALAAGFDGHAVMRCSVKADGTLGSCAIISEQPLGWGFGDAMLRLAPYFRMTPPTSDGKPVEGGVVIIPLGWQLHPGPPRSSYGEAGYVLTVTGPGAAKATTIDCPTPSEPKRLCEAHEVAWEESPLVAPVSAVLDADPKLKGRSRLYCTVGSKRELTNCLPAAASDTGQATAMSALAGKFRTNTKTRDGLDVLSGKPIAVDFDWDELSREIARLRRRH